MKNIIYTTILTALFVSAMAQAPQGISHQAVIRDASNQFVTESPIGIQISIIQGTPEGTIVYSETHLPNSNANGLISFIIGQGALVSGVFAEIDWAAGPYFFKTQADPTGGTNYTIEGISQMLSVPYAYHSSSLTLTSGNGFIYNLTISDDGSIIANLVADHQPCPGTPTVTDIEGNVYNTVLIGNQCWMKENLKTTKYRNNTPIEYPDSNNSAWQNNTTGAYAWYNNDIGWKDSYGALYNWHAVNNANGLCPSGWNVPTDAEFTAMTNHLGGASVAGGKMKSTLTAPEPHPRWESPNTGATNESNWSGLPGGNRSFSGAFNVIGGVGYWWSATEVTATFARYRDLGYNYSVVGRDFFNKTYGFSVRCLRDN